MELCIKLLRKLHLYLDGELTKEEEKDILDHLHKCPKCLEKHDLEVAFREFLRQKCGSTSADPELVNQLKSKIQLSIMESSG